MDNLKALNEIILLNQQIGEKLYKVNELITSLVETEEDRYDNYDYAFNRGYTLGKADGIVIGQAEERRKDPLKIILNRNSIINNGDE